ncbi:hypothetical protein NliqN6_1140 [Naganishia liquefaciens]|uniref:Uncharacterized protein n=1 Tax=Naganishia liquefaciens TaxID=104408 RepID=A0A8H3TPV5_9TREE|nr:hypothetical protein NliqN6_1140 [Naganishia liquefaciens]
MELLNRLDFSNKWVKQRSTTESADEEHFRAGGHGDSATDHTALSEYDEQDNARDYPGKSGSIDLPSVPSGLAAAYFNGEFEVVGDWATGLENGDTGVLPAEEATKDMGATPGTNILAEIQKQASLGLPTAEAQQTDRQNDLSHAQTEPFLVISQKSYADSPFNPDGFRVENSSDYREASFASGGFSDSRESEKHYAGSDHESISSERHEEHEHRSINDPPECVRYEEPFSPFFARFEREGYLEEEEPKELTQDGFQHQFGELLREAGEDAVKQAVEDLFLEYAL